MSTFSEVTHLRTWLLVQPAPPEGAGARDTSVPQDEATGPVLTQGEAKRPPVQHLLSA